MSMSAAPSQPWKQKLLDASQREAFVLWSLLSFAFLLRAICAWRVAVIFNDGPIFLAIAEEMGMGRWETAFSYDYHPLYSFLIYLFSGREIDPAFTGVLISIVAGSLAVPVLYVLLRQIWDREVATLGAFILAISPYSIRFSADVQSDALYLLLFIASVACLYRVLESPTFWGSVASGLLVGLAYLVRPEGLVVAVAGCVIFGIFWLWRFWDAPMSLRAGLGLLLGVLIPTLPYFWFLNAETGTWQLSQKKSVFVLLGLMDLPVHRGGEIIWNWSSDAIYIVAFLFCLSFVFFWVCWVLRKSRALESVVTPRRILIVAFAWVVLISVLKPAGVLEFVLTAVSTLRPEILLVLLLGIWGGGLQAGRNGSILLAVVFLMSVVILLALLMQYGYLSRRHVLPPLVLVFGYCAMGISFLSTRCSDSRFRLVAGRRIRAGVMICALLTLISLPKAWSDSRGEEFAGRLAAEWLRSSSLGSGVLASERSKLAYYADTRWYPLLSEDNLIPLRQLHRSGVRFIVIEGGPSEGWSRLGPPPRGVDLLERYQVSARGRVAYVLEFSEREPQP